MQSFFVSSTFKDMQGERDALHRLVMPQLRDMAAEYGESIQFVDLRWGISTTDLDSDAGARKILGVCLNEIRQCKPYMIVLLGERYGWMPSPELLRGAAEEMDFPAESYEMSVTELEIQYGIYLAQNRLDHCIFCLRDPVPSEGLSEELRNIYLPGSEADSRRMEKLKEKILKTSGATVIRYGLDWDAENKCFTGYDSFAARLSEAVEQMLRQQWRDRRAMHWQEKQREDDKLLISMHQSSFVGRARELREMHEALKSHKILILEGEGGCGKSALMAQLCKEVQAEGYNAEMFCCGNSVSCMSAAQLLRLLCLKLLELDIESRYDTGRFVQSNDVEEMALLERSLLDVESNPSDASDELRDTFHMLTRDYSGPPLVFFLDAIDQLIPDRALYESWFVPEQLPDQCRIVISTTGTVRVNPLAIPQGKKAIASKTVILSPPEQEELREILNARFLAEHKQISKAVADEILENPCSKNMLGMEVMIRRLVMLGQADFREIAELEKTMDGAAAIDTYLIKLVKGFSKDLGTLIIDYMDTVIHFLGEARWQSLQLPLYIIAVMQHGISGGDLERLNQLLKTDNGYLSVGTDSMWYDFWDPIMFSRLKRYLGSLMIQRADGRIDLSHRLLREALQGRFGTGFIAIVLRCWLYAEPGEGDTRQENLLVLTRMSEEYNRKSDKAYKPNPEIIRAFFCETIQAAGNLADSEDPREAAEGARQIDILKQSILYDLNSEHGWTRLATYCSILDLLIEDGSHPNNYTVWFFGEGIANELEKRGEKEKAMAIQLLYSMTASMQRQKDRLDAGNAGGTEPWNRVGLSSFLNYHIKCLRMLSELHISMKLGLVKLRGDYGNSPELLLKSGMAAAEEGIKLYPGFPRFRWNRASLYGYTAKLNVGSSFSLRTTKSETYVKTAFQYAMDAFKAPADTGNPEQDRKWEKRSAEWLLYAGSLCLEALADDCIGRAFLNDRPIRLAESIRSEIQAALDGAGMKLEDLDVLDTARFICAVNGCIMTKGMMHPKRALEITAEGAEMCGDYYFRLRQDKDRCAALSPEARNWTAILGMELGDLLLHNLVPQCLKDAGYRLTDALRYIIDREGGYIQAQSRSDYQSRQRYAELLCMEAVIHSNVRPTQCIESCDRALEIISQFEKTNFILGSTRRGNSWHEAYSEFVERLRKSQEELLK